MRLFLALKLFIKAWKNPTWARSQIAETTQSDSSHLTLLSILQKNGRLIDFFQENISQFNDSEIGSAVRKVHQECQQSLEKLVALRPVISHEEGSSLTVPAGYNVDEIKVIGKVRGSPPYTGILRHRGWKAEKLTLPQTSTGMSVLCPAEVEIS